MKPIAIYSDFDGVYNVSPSKSTVTATIQPENSEFLARKSKITWEPEIVELLQDLLATDLYDFIWHTTWNHAGNIKNAANIMGLEGVETYSPVSLNRGARSRKEWTSWKAKSIVEDQTANPRPFIWIDDSAPIYWGDHVQGHVKSPSLVIIPNSKQGLTKDEILKVVEWTEKIKKI